MFCTVQECQRHRSSTTTSEMSTEIGKLETHGKGGNNYRRGWEWTVAKEVMETRDAVQLMI